MKFQQDNLHVQGILGYKKEEWEWEASDGYWIYIQELRETFEEGIVGIGTAGELEGVGIRYKQKMTIPYIGIGIGLTGKHIDFEAHALYSNRVEIKATDDHLERNLRTVDSLEDGEYWSVGLNHTWKMSPKLSFVASVEYEEIRTVKGESKWTFYDENIEEVVEDGAGAGYHATAISFSMVYVF
jgi:outer membrane protease